MMIKNYYFLLIQSCSFSRITFRGKGILKKPELNHVDSVGDSLKNYCNAPGRLGQCFDNFCTSW